MSHYAIGDCCDAGDAVIPAEFVFPNAPADDPECRSGAREFLRKQMKVHPGRQCRVVLWREAFGEQTSDHSLGVIYGKDGNIESDWPK